MPNFKNNDNTACVFAENDGAGVGVYGFSTGAGGPVTESGYGVVGLLGGDPGLYPFTMNAAAVIGLSNVKEGVVGVSSAQAGVLGISDSHAGVSGQCAPFATNTTGTGVMGTGGSVGVFGQGHDFGVKGVAMFQSNGVGVWGESMTSNGVLGLSHHPVNAGVSSINDAGGLGLYAESKGGAWAAHIEGNLQITGNASASDVILTGADCAEDFEVSEDSEVEPGTVMVLGEEGLLHPGSEPYDRKVAGILSGAGDYRPGIVLDKRHSSRRRMALALVGKVYCKVDARFSPVEVGDLLTTSSTRGHAMKAVNAERAFGCVIGKALRALSAGRGLIPVLVTLQ